VGLGFVARSQVGTGEGAGDSSGVAVGVGVGVAIGTDPQEVTSA